MPCPILTCLALAQALAPPASGSAEQRALWERGRQQQSDRERTQFDRAGFPPFASIVQAGRTVRRLALSDPYGFLPVAGIEIERRADGGVTITVIGPYAPSDPVVPGRPIPLPAAAWDDLDRLQGTIFAAPPYRPWQSRKPDDPVPPPPRVCHGWSARLAATIDRDIRTIGWSACGGAADAPELAYATRIVALALATRPDCVSGADSFWSFQACFAPVRKADDDR